MRKVAPAAKVFPREGFSFSQPETFALLIHWYAAVEPETAAVCESRAE
jgi:hypothetical protein